MWCVLKYKIISLNGHHNLGVLYICKVGSSMPKRKTTRLFTVNFFEAFEAFHAIEDPRAVSSLEYVLSWKTMVVSQADDVAGIMSSKAGLSYVGPDLDAMKATSLMHTSQASFFTV